MTDQDRIEMDRICDEMFERARQYKGPSIEEAEREMNKLMDEAFPKEGSVNELVKSHRDQWAEVAKQESDRAAQTDAALKAKRDARIAKVRSECTPAEFRAVELLVHELFERGKFTDAELADGNAFRAALILIQNGWISQVM